jgi:chromosome segregation ATPase
MSKYEELLKQKEESLTRACEKLTSINHAISLMSQHRRKAKERAEFLKAEVDALKQGQLQLDVEFDLEF